MEVEEKEEEYLQPGMRNPTKESQILLWTWKVLNEVTTTDYDLYLKDGTVLCRLMNSVCPGSVQGELKYCNNKERTKNIGLFLKAAEKYGVDKKLLFEIDDLLLLRHIPKVTRCIFTLGKLAAEDDSYRGPLLGEEPYEGVGSKGRHRGCLPLGDDIYVAHISVDKITETLLKPEVKEKKRISLFNFWTAPEDTITVFALSTLRFSYDNDPA